MTKPPDLADIEEQIELLGVEKKPPFVRDYEKAADLGTSPRNSEPRRIGYRRNGVIP